MKNQVCWTERLEDGVRREIRVTFSRNGLKWQFKRSDEDRWVYDRTPTPAEWADLEERVLNRYQRRAVPFKDLEQVRAARARAGG
jgi:hypothetical protein